MMFFLFFYAIFAAWLHQEWLIIKDTYSHVCLS